MRRWTARVKVWGLAMVTESTGIGGGGNQMPGVYRLINVEPNCYQQILYNDELLPDLPGLIWAIQDSHKELKHVPPD